MFALHVLSTSSHGIPSNRLTGKRVTGGRPILECPFLEIEIERFALFGLWCITVIDTQLHAIDTDHKADRGSVFADDLEG